MRILIVGAGATGGFFGTLMAQSGRDVTFLARDRRAAQLRRTGLKVEREQATLEIQPKVVTAAEIEKTYDLVILAVKAYALHAAIDDFADAVGSQTAILPLLNGMHHMDVLEERFGLQRLLGCQCKVVTSLNDEGNVVQQGALAEMSYGELDGTISDRLERIHETMSNAGFATSVSTNIKRAMWEKWLLLAALGSINSLMRGSIGEVMATPGGREIINLIFDEILGVTRFVGEPPSESFIQQARKLLTLEGSTQTSSMYRDMVSGRPVEADQIIGDLIFRAESVGLEAPYLSLAYSNLLIHQSKQSMSQNNKS